MSWPFSTEHSRHLDRLRYKQEKGIGLTDKEKWELRRDAESKKELQDKTDDVLDIYGMAFPVFDLLNMGRKAYRGDTQDAAASAVAAFTPLPAWMKTGASDALSKVSKRFGVDDSIRRKVVNFGQEYAERNAIGSALGSLKNGGKIRRMDPKMLLAQKMLLKGNK